MIREQTGFRHKEYIDANGTDKERRPDAREQALSLKTLVYKIRENAFVLAVIK